MLLVAVLRVPNSGPVSIHFHRGRITPVGHQLPRRFVRWVPMTLARIPRCHPNRRLAVRGRSDVLCSETNETRGRSSRGRAQWERGVNQTPRDVNLKDIMYKTFNCPVICLFTVHYPQGTQNSTLRCYN